MILSFVILICIVLTGILFDIIGVAVTAADEVPFHAMASRKVPEAEDALRLIRNAGQGLVVLQRRDRRHLRRHLRLRCGGHLPHACCCSAESGSEIFITLLLSAVVSGVTVGGKACGKSLAMNSSTAVVRTAAKVLCFFRTLPQRLEKKSAKK